MARRFPLTKRISWRFEYAGYRVMAAALSIIPFSIIDRAGATIGFFFYFLSPRYRALAIRNLRIAYGKEKTSSQIKSLARETCQRTIANFLGTLKTTILPTKEVEEQVSLLGIEHLYEALAQGKGAILVLGHMGNWEILNRLHQFLPANTPAGGIYQPLKNPLVDAHLLERREQDGSKFFNKREGFHAPASFVKKGGLLIVVADQKVGRAGVPIPFFGRLSSLSPLPALLARKAGAPVLAAGIETVAPGKWQVVCQPLSDRPRTEEIISSLETLIRRAPADYLWLHNRWKLDGRYPLSSGSKKSNKPLPATTPLRALIITEHEPDFETLTKFLKQRHQQDLPLSFEYLVIRQEPQQGHPTKEFPIYEAVAPTAELLSAQIKKIDHLKPYPLETALIETPNSTIQRALTLTTIPRTLTNRERLPFSEFLQTLTAPQREE